jgi:hypothetical protein
MSYIDTNRHTVVRDLSSKGLIITDHTELQRSRATRGRVRHQRESYDNQMSHMSQRLDRCETMLIELIRHMNELVSRLKVEE